MVVTRPAYEAGFYIQELDVIDLAASVASAARGGVLRAGGFGVEGADALVEEVPVSFTVDAPGRGRIQVRVLTSTVVTPVNQGQAGTDVDIAVQVFARPQAHLVQRQLLPGPRADRSPDHSQRRELVPMSTEDREREFSAAALLRAGWSVPLAFGMGSLVAACGGGGHDDVLAEALELTRGDEPRSGCDASHELAGRWHAVGHDDHDKPVDRIDGAFDARTTRPPNLPGGGAHTDVPHVDSAHGDVPAATVLHTDEHGDTPESTHDDILAFERGEGPRFVTFPHFDVPHSDVPHTDQAHVDAPHVDTPHADA